MENQIKMQYSVNRQIMKNFNKTVQDIQFNNIILKSKILQIQDVLKTQTDHFDILTMKDLLNQLVILYNVILNILQDVETSITFCKLKLLHPSIITSSDLFLELQKLSKHYGNELPFELNSENVLEIESILTVNYKIDKNRIIYLLTIPIDFITKFKLYYLLPIPALRGSELVTIIPDIKYFLKSDNEIKPLSDICIKSTVYQCPAKLKINHRSPCEEEILLNGTTNNCQPTKLEIDNNHIEMIPEINQYLAVFPKKETISIQCKEDSEIKALKGIFLIKENACKLYFKNEELIYQSTSYGQPNIINHIPLVLGNHGKSPNFTLKLKTLKLEELQSNPSLMIQDHQPSDQSTSYSLNIWTIILYLCFLIVAVSITIKFLVKKIRSRPGQQPAKENVVNLPGGASF